jgi:hypothetical protein
MLNSQNSDLNTTSGSDEEVQGYSYFSPTVKTAGQTATLVVPVLPQRAPSDAQDLSRFLHNIVPPFVVPVPGFIDPPKPYLG